MLLSDGTGLAVDRVVFGSGYRAELTKVPYLAGVLKHVKVSNGFPVLDEASRRAWTACTSRVSRRHKISGRSSVSSKGDPLPPR